MNQRSSFVLVAVGLVLGLGERLADAGLVTWQFGGEITLVHDPDNELGDAITVGTPFSGSFTFESTTPDSSPESVEIGRYINAITAISGQVGAFAFSGVGAFNSEIRITDSPGGDNDIFAFGTEDIIFSNSSSVFSSSLSLSNADGSIFASDALPLFPPDLTSLGLSTFSFKAGPGGAFFTGDLIVLVPEPGSLVLLAFGALALVKRRRFSRSLGAFIILLVLRLGMPADLHAQQWDPNWGPVIIGGDDLDEHRSTGGEQGTAELTGDAFIREGLKFLVANVKNGKTVEGLVL